jgi:hypothetical protein
MDKGRATGFVRSRLPVEASPSDSGSLPSKGVISGVAIQVKISIPPDTPARRDPSESISPRRRPKEALMVRNVGWQATALTQIKWTARLLLLVVFPVLTGCSWGETKSKLDQNLISKYGLKDEDFKQLQYYLATDLVLTREVSREEKKERVKGELVERQGEVVQEVVINPGTPGVCLGTERLGDGSHRLEISFEEGTSLKFVRLSPEGAYTIEGKEQGDVLDVNFAGDTYRVPKKQADAAYLVVSEKPLKNAETRRRTLGGRKLEK